MFLGVRHASSGKGDGYGEIGSDTPSRYSSDILSAAVIEMNFQGHILQVEVVGNADRVLLTKLKQPHVGMHNDNGSQQSP
jgi:hypothetical protein